MHGQHQTHAGRQIERQGGLDHRHHALCCPFHPSCQVPGFILDFSKSSSVFWNLTLQKYDHFHFPSGASCLMVRRMGSSKSKPCNWWVFSFYSNLISVYVLIDNLFKIRFNGRFSQQYALHPPRYYLHVDWERLSDTQVIVVLKLIRNK